jgi:tight adherence protein B
MPIAELLLLLLLACAAALLAMALQLPRLQRRKELEKALARYTAPVGDTVARTAGMTADSRVHALAKSVLGQETAAGRIATLALRWLAAWSELRQTGGATQSRKVVVATVVAFATSLAVGAWLHLALPLLLPVALLGAVAGQWATMHTLRKRLQQAFLRDFADAVDIIVRGVRAGMPVGECLRMVSHDCRPPLNHLFGLVVQEQALGTTLEEALHRFSSRMPVPEVRLFVTVLSIQAKTGGGLAEALANLSGVLRARRRLRLRIRAISAEAKSSAMIIGAMPFVLGIVLYFASPNYIALLFTHPVGQSVLWACGAWMLIGTFVMRRMIDLRI